MPLKKILTGLLLLTLLVFALPQSSYAFDPFNAGGKGVNCGKDINKDSAVCSSATGKDPITGTDGLLVKITKIIAFVAGAAAIIVIIVGGIKFATSGGDSNSVASARNTVLYALIGLVVIALAQTVIVFIVRRL